MEKEGTTMGHGRWYKTTFAHLQMCYCDRVQIMATLACLVLVSVIQQSSNETVCMWTLPVITNLRMDLFQALVETVCM